MDSCPCGSGTAYAGCCGPLHAGAVAATAEALMRSRYSAYVLKNEGYLLSSWHPDTRPGSLELASDNNKWLGLAVKRHVQHSDDSAAVEFVARYRIAGRGYRMHEVSEFVRENGRWLYLRGDVSA